MQQAEQAGLKGFLIKPAIESARSLDTISVKAKLEPSRETMAEMPLELAHKAIIRLREAAEMGDVSVLIAVAEELTSGSKGLRPISDQTLRAAEDFDFENVLTLVEKMEKD